MLLVINYDLKSVCIHRTTWGLGVDLFELHRLDPNMLFWTSQVTRLAVGVEILGFVAISSLTEKTSSTYRLFFLINAWQEVIFPYYGTIILRSCLTQLKLWLLLVTAPLLAWRWWRGFSPKSLTPWDGKCHPCSPSLRWNGGERMLESSTMAWRAIPPGIKDPKNNIQSIVERKNH